MEIFHVLNRGVDKRKIFLSDLDYFRFVHDLYAFNDKNVVNTTFKSFCINKELNDIGSRTNDGKEHRELLVNIHAFCLMPNHYHLLLTERIDGGISKFMKKVNMGYAKYFNQKYERKGALFEGRYKSILVKNDAHFIYLPYYIHLNPLDLIMPEWRKNKIYDYKKAIQFLENYRWSSFIDYSGGKNFSSVISKNLLMDFFEKESQFKYNIQKFIKNVDLNSMKGITLEDLS